MDRLDSYLDAWRARWEREREADARAAAAARSVAERLAEILRDRYRVRRVLLVGSLARGEFRRGSDIDLAVEGLADADFFRAGAELEAAAGLPVDLVPLESADAAYREEVARDGIVLHDTGA